MSFTGSGETLKEVLPHDASLDLEGTDKRLAKLLELEVVSKHDGREERWPGRHKNVFVWWTLKDGHAVGLNENPSVGWSFPICRVTRKG